MKAILRKLLILPLALVALPAVAHSGHGTETIGFLAGLIHPVTGLDHLLAMLAVGFWSATTTRRIWLAPLVFANVLLLGALLAVNGLAFPAVELMIVASVLVLGLLIMAHVSLPESAATALISGCALFHGTVHGAELGTSIALAGMVTSTALLHGIGITAGCLLRTRNQLWRRGIGAGITLTGVGLALNLV